MQLEGGLHLYPCHSSFINIATNIIVQNKLFNLFGGDCWYSLHNILILGLGKSSKMEAQYVILADFQYL